MFMTGDKSSITQAAKMIGAEIQREMKRYS